MSAGNVRPDSEPNPVSAANYRLDRIKNRSGYLASGIILASITILGLVGYVALMLLFNADTLLSDHNDYFLPAMLGWLLVLVLIGFLPCWDTVNWIRLGPRLRVHRLTSIRDFHPDRVISICLERRAQDDFDELRNRPREIEVTICLRRAFSTWLVVAQEDAESIRQWAHAQGRMVVDKAN